MAADDDAAAAAEAMEHGDTYFLGSLPLVKGSGAGGKALLLQALKDENVGPDVPGAVVPPAQRMGADLPAWA